MGKKLNSCNALSESFLSENSEYLQLLNLAYGTAKYILKFIKTKPCKRERENHSKGTKGIKKNFYIGNHNISFETQLNIHIKHAQA